MKKKEGKSLDLFISPYHSRQNENADEGVFCWSDKMNLNLEPIGIIKKAANKSEILIYADFEQIIRNIVAKIGEGAEAGQKLLVIHKNNNSKKPDDGHQVRITKTTLLERKGNLLTVSEIDANEESVIDVRLDLLG